MMDSAWAQATGAEGQSQGFLDVLRQMAPMWIAIIAIFYFLMIRPAQKKQRDRAAMLNNIKKGDKVVTTGGLIGTVVGTSEKTLVLKVADNVKIKLMRSAIAGPAEPEN